MSIFDAKCFWRKPMPVAVMTYFDKWVPAATRNKARYSHCVTGSEMNFYVFICSCGSNINIGQSQFAGIGDQIANNCAVPFALQEWVKEHRHVCDKFWIDPDWKNGSLSGKMCSTCGWNEEAHDKKPLSKEDVKLIDKESLELTKWQSQMMKNAIKLKTKKSELEEKVSWTSYKVGYTTSVVNPFKSYSVEPDMFELETAKAEPLPEELPILEQPTGRKFRK